MEQNVTQVSKGLYTDSSPKYQPKETYRFALNTVQETEEGDFNSLSNEESNEVYTNLPEGYKPIGKVYIGDGATALCLVNRYNTISEIGVLTDKGTYETYMNDANSVNKINFHESRKVQMTYRLRRGCERTLYIADGTYPKYFNLDGLEKFKTDGLFDAEKFKLFKTFNDIPEFNNIEVTNGGILPSGSYNFGIQYLDEDLNPTEWITTTDTVIIYNDSTEGKPFPEVRGSTNKKTDYQDFGDTGKAIAFDLSNLNNSFPFYRIAVIEANTGSGEVSRVLYSPEQITQNSHFVYSGEIEGFTNGTRAEVATFNTILDKVEHIEQIENRLILANTKGKEINYCALQKYASKIKSNYTLRKIKLDDLDSRGNPKRGEVHNETVGYMPGEIYSFGIVYVFEDGTQSPAYHIPGRTETTHDSNMSVDNILGNTQYIDNDTCGDGIWGVDAQGNQLLNEYVRHHRFPSRGEIGEPLFKKEFSETPGSGTSQGESAVFLNIAGKISPAETRTHITYELNYSRDGLPQVFTGQINVADYNSGEVDRINPDYQNIYLFSYPNSIIEIGYAKEVTDDSVGFEGHLLFDARLVNGSGGQYTPPEEGYVSNILGIEFNNISKPSLSDTFGQDVVGYYIVRNERRDNSRTILDSGTLTPLLEEVTSAQTTKFVAHGHLAPVSTMVKQDVFGLIHPEHKFNGKEYKNATEYVKEGEFTIEGPQQHRSLFTQDVMPGTSYDPENHKRREKDSDGFTLHNNTRNSNLTYKSVTPEVLASEQEIEETFYLDTLFSKTITDSDSKRKSIYNLSADNKIGILHLNKKLPKESFKKKYPYIVIKRHLSDPYGNFRSLPFYKEHNNLKKFGGPEDIVSSGPIYNGDSYISSMKYVSTMYYATVMRKRSSKRGFFNFVLGVLSVIAGTLITIGTLGGGAALGITLISFGVTQFATGLKKEQLSRVYGELYEQGLKDTVDDDYTKSTFHTGNRVEDDEIQWFQDSLSNLWFESNVNMNWRMGSTIGIPDFMNSPTGYDSSTYTNYALEKVTTLDSEADGGRTYQGFAKAELYEVNKDFNRRNREKKHFALGLEYDCCSDCIEEFPHRVHYSEQSFQEELTDNYRVFLPNNYRDIEGETGEVTNLFRIQNNLYIHTEEALWHLPQTFQERVTGDIVSFVGTGEYFSVPPRKIIDDQNGHSAGTKHKWGTIKTPYGVFFPGERQGTFYKFSGENIESLSSSGNFNWFKNNMKLKGVGTDVGFIAVYDSRKERVIFTKKDYIPQTVSTNPTIQRRIIDNSWTMSYSLKTEAWVSWHSYMPDFYITTPNKFFSWKRGNNGVWLHNVKGTYQNFYGIKYPYIIEYVGTSEPLRTKIWESIVLLTEAYKYDPSVEDYFEKRFTTFNKAVLFNERQCTGEMNLIVKDTNPDSVDYLSQQVRGQQGNNIIIDRNEKNWNLNDIRDIRIDYETPIWNTLTNSLQSRYYIDKTLNSASMDIDKDWTQLESFRGKYLVVRLIFDTFDDVKLVFNASVENEDISIR